MGNSVESRFERYTQVMVEALGHADRATPARWYLQGLMLPGQRKSVEPMAARVHPEDVRSAHQSMHHLVGESQWSDAALFAAVAREVVPILSEAGQARCFWIIDDTGFRKYGKHSVGVARQYCGQLGKTENCQVAVSLSLASAQGSVPLDYRLYLPQEWAKDKARRKLAGVPKEIAFATKGELAWAQIEAALAAGIPRATLLMDAGYGDETALRDRLSAHGAYSKTTKSKRDTAFLSSRCAPIASTNADSSTSRSDAAFTIESRTSNPSWTGTSYTVN